MRKETCAVQQKALVSLSPEVTDLPIATWDTARSCMRAILSEAAASQGQQQGHVPLSSVKRAFRAKFKTELSETMLGHSKLSELLQDQRFRDVCTVRLEGHGYTVMQTRISDASVGSAYSQSDEDVSELDEPLCLEIDPDAGGNEIFEATPCPFSSSPMQRSMLSPIAGFIPKSEWLSVCPSTFPDVDIPGSMPYFAPYAIDVGNLSGSTTARSASTKGDAETKVSSTEVAQDDADELRFIDDMKVELVSKQMFAGEPLSLDDLDFLANAPQPRGAALPSLSPSVVKGMIHNTFIHAALPPPTPVQGSLRRSMSLPKDLWGAVSRVDCAHSESSSRDMHGASFEEFRFELCGTPLSANPSPGIALRSPALTASPGAGFTPRHLQSFGIWDPPRVLSLADHLFA